MRKKWNNALLFRKIVKYTVDAIPVEKLKKVFKIVKTIIEKDCRKGIVSVERIR